MGDFKQKKDNDFAASVLRHLGQATAKILHKLYITPIQVTVVSFVVCAPLVIYFFTKGTYLDNLIALFFVFIAVVFDLADGSLAKLRGIYSHRGAYLDTSLDKLFQYGILLAVTIGTFRAADSPGWLVWGIILLATQAMADFIGAQYEKEFGFDAYAGSTEFLAKYQATDKVNLVDAFLKNIIVPCRQSFIALFTIRYWLIFGIVLNQLPMFLVIATVMLSVRWITMWLLYLAFLDSTRTDLKTITFLKELRRK